MILFVRFGFEEITFFFWIFLEMLVFKIFFSLLGFVSYIVGKNLYFCVINVVLGIVNI